MFPAPHVGDAVAYVVEKLRSDPNGYIDQNNRYDVWLPNLVWKYLVTAGYPQQRQMEYQEDSELQDVWRAFYDAAWRLCRLGILRPTVSWHTGGGNSPPPGQGYSYTSNRRAWLETSELQLIPSDPARYVALLSKEVERLGKGFAQRAREAAACHQTGNHLACCAMCGAAAESAILQTAIHKTSDEKRVLEAYIKSNGRRRVIEMIFGASPSKLGGASEIRTRGAPPRFDGRIRPEFGALFGPKKSIHAGENLFT
jgi:hypothetical protein